LARIIALPEAKVKNVRSAACCGTVSLLRHGLLTVPLARPKVSCCHALAANLLIRYHAG